MQRLLNLVAYAAALIVVIYSVGMRFQSGDALPERRPVPERVQPTPTAPQQPALPSTGPTFTVETGEIGPSTGTAFAVDPDGWWLTARHVVDGCDQVLLVTGRRRGVAARDIFIHDNADIALLRARLERRPLPFRAGAPQQRQAGFSMGYPGGKPGEVHAQLLGGARLRTVGRYRMNEPVLAWAEVRRVPARLQSLGGLSGGPMLDDAGNVVGVTVAESRRRGRVMTAAPESLENLLAHYRLAPPGGDAPTGQISAGNFTAVGDRLRRNLTVAQVYCSAPKKGRLRRR